MNNLPKGDRVKKVNLLTSILVPSPNEPGSRSMKSFLAPLMAELLILDQGIHGIDRWLKERFILKAHLISILADMMAVRKMLLFKGPNAIKPCRVCNITGKLRLFSVPYASQLRYTLLLFHEISIHDA